MLKSIIVTAIRNIYRNKTFSAINFFGLAVSMSLGLLIILIVREQYSFDSFHSDIDRIYRVNTRVIRTDDFRNRYATAPLPVATSLLQDYSFTNKVVRIDNQLSGDVEYGNTIVPITGFFADPSFLEVFNFRLEKGAVLTALRDPGSLVLTQDAKRKIFGNTPAIGKSIRINGYGDFVVSGVLEKFPSKTHLDFEVLASSSLLPVLEKNGAIMPTLDNWYNYNTGYVYFKANDGVDEASINLALAEIVKNGYDQTKLDGNDKGFEFYLQRLNEITPGPELENQMGRGLPSMVSNFFLVLAGLVILMACFNYTNLMIAKSLSRAKEIGIRKAIGANRFQIFFQFVAEAVVFSLMSLAFSYVFLQLLKPAFLQLHLTSEFSVNLDEDLTVYTIFVLFAIVVGILAGLLPAIYLSAIKAMKVLKDAGATKVYARVSFRKILMVVQFAMSSVFIMVILIINGQAKFMIATDYGFDDHKVIDIKLAGNKPTILINEIEKLAGVEKVGMVSQIPGTWETHLSDYKSIEADKFYGIRDYFVDDSYLSVIGIDFVAGGNFAGTEGADARKIIINKSALIPFEFPTAEAAIGETILTSDSLELQIIGVVNDFHFRPLNNQIGPLVIRNDFLKARYLSVRTATGQDDQVLAAIPGIWSEVDPIHPLEMKRMNDEIDEAYVASGFMDLVTIVGYISFMLSTIACFGMLAMAMYSTRTRIKEIGIRKVLGASSAQIVLIISKSFLIMVGIAISIGLPIGYFLGDTFISSYAYRIEITVGMLMAGALLLAFLGIITIASQAVSAARNNPVDALRCE